MVDGGWGTQLAPVAHAPGRGSVGPAGLNRQPFSVYLTTNHQPPTITGRDTRACGAVLLRGRGGLLAAPSRRLRGFRRIRTLT